MATGAATEAAVQTEMAARAAAAKAGAERARVATGVAARVAAERAMVVAGKGKGPRILDPGMHTPALEEI